MISRTRVPLLAACSYPVWGVRGIFIVLIFFQSIGCLRSDIESPSNSDVPTTTSDAPQLLLSRVTSMTRISTSPPQLALGHENGVISIWRWPISSTQSIPAPQHSWMGHEGAVRTLTYDHAQEKIMSLGADGSWARWSHNTHLIKRQRALDLYANRVTPDGQGGWLIAGARGVVARWLNQKRVWVNAGEHGRAAFDIALMDAQRAISVGSDGWARCWLIESGESCGQLPLHQGWAITLQPVRVIKETVSTTQNKISADHTQSQTNWWLSAGSDGWIKVWSPTQLNTLLDASLKTAQQTPLQGERQGVPPPAHAQYQAHQKDITRLTHHDNLVLSGSEEGSVTLLRLTPKGELKHQWTQVSPQVKPVLSLMIDSKHQRALIGGGAGRGLIWSSPLNPTSQPKPSQSLQRLF